MTNHSVHSARSRRGELVAVLSLCAMALLLGGCSDVGDFEPPGAYDEVQQAADELDLSSAGEIASEAVYGGALWFGGDPTYVAIFNDDSAIQDIEENLIREGYSLEGNSETYWVRTDGDLSLAVHAHVVKPGDEVTVSADGDPLVIDQPGTMISIRGS